MTIDRRAFMQAMGLGAGGAYLAGSLPRARAQARPAQARRFVLLVEGNGIEPGTFASPAALAAIEDQATASPYRTVGGQVQLDPAMNRGYGHEELMNIGPDSLSDAPALSALAEGEHGESLIADATVLLGLSSLITGGGHTSNTGALSCMRAGIGNPGGQTIDTLLGSLPEVRRETPFDVVRIGIGSNPNPLVHATCALGPKRPASIILDPITTHGYLFGSVGNAASIRAFRKRARLLDFAKDDVTRRLARFRGLGEEREKLVRYGESIDALRLRGTRLVNMAQPLRQLMPPVSVYPGGFYEAPPLTRLADQFDLAFAALRAALTNVVVIGSGSGLSGFDLAYQTLSRESPRRHDLHHLAGEDSSARPLIYEVTARHVAEVARLARRLKAIPEGDGTMLDNTVILYMSDNGNTHHSHGEEWPILLMGGANMGLRTGGRTLVYPRANRPNNRQVSNLFNTLGYCAGIQLDRFGGEGGGRIAAGPLSELWRAPG